MLDSAQHSCLNQTAAILMAAAVVELFPDVLLVKGEGTPDRFFCDFVFPFEFKNEFLTFIEERMRLILRAKPEIRCLEMMPANAAELLRHLGQHVAADAMLDEQRTLVQLCKIGDYAAYAKHPFQDELNIPYLKILEAFPINETTLRIVGVAATDKNILKSIAKEPSVSSRSHLILARQAQLLEPMEGYWLWRPQGVVLREQLIQLWKEEHLKQNFSFISTPSTSEQALTQAHRDYFLRFGTEKIAEMALVSDPHSTDPALGLLSPKTYFADRAHLFCPNEKLLEETISSLQFILHIPKILGFEYEVVLSLSSRKTQSAAVLQQALEKLQIAYTLEEEYRPGMLASIDVRLADALGRRWTGPFLGMPEGKSKVLIRSAFGSLERIVALLLEQKGGRLPVRFAPEQARILTAQGKLGSYVRQVSASLKAQGVRAKVDDGDAPLKRRLYQAMMEKVPFVLLLGEREEKAKTLTVRAYGESEEQTLSVDEFCMRVNMRLSLS